MKINGVEYLTVPKAAEIYGYSPKYVNRMAREEKVDAVKIKNRWFVSEPSVRKRKGSWESVLNPEIHDGYVPIEEASELTKRDREYVSRLARMGKLKATKIKVHIGWGTGYKWYFNSTSLSDYIRADKRREIQHFPLINEGDLNDDLIPLSETGYCYVTICKLHKNNLIEAVRLEGRIGKDAVYVSQATLEMYKEFSEKVDRNVNGHKNGSVETYKPNTSVPEDHVRAIRLAEELAVHRYYITLWFDEGELNGFSDGGKLYINTDEDLERKKLALQPTY